MTRDLLEAALNKTKELEEKEMKTRKLAENIGKYTGVAFAICLDSLFVWLIVKFMIGVAGFTFLGALGVMLLANLVYVKFKR